MTFRHIVAGSLAVALCCNVAGFAISNADSMRGAAAVKLNTKLATSVSVTKDAYDNIVSFHVNGINACDAETLIWNRPCHLSTEFTLIDGVNDDGTSCCYMMPTNVATPLVVEAISKDLVNSGAISLKISKQRKGVE